MNGDSGGRRSRGSLRGAMVASGVLHAALIVAVAIGASRAASLPKMKVYAVNIVSPPPQEAGEPVPAAATPEPAVAEPEPPPPEPEPPLPEPDPVPPPPEPKPAPPKENKAPPREPEPKPEPKPAPPKEPEPQPKKEEPKPEPPKPTPSRGDNPVASSAGGEGLNVRTEGAEFVDAAYLQNIVRQINRYFRRPSDARTDAAEVRFWINRDGTVSDIETVQATGSFSFRAAAMEAVEQAGLNRAFGPLPDAYSADRLAISFYFRPAR